MSMADRSQDDYDAEERANALFVLFLLALGVAGLVVWIVR